MAAPDLTSLTYNQLLSLRERYRGLCEHHAHLSAVYSDRLYEVLAELRHRPKPPPKA